jgi:hypothetical protein
MRLRREMMLRLDRVGGVRIWQRGQRRVACISVGSEIGGGKRAAHGARGVAYGGRRGCIAAARRGSAWRMLFAQRRGGYLCCVRLPAAQALIVTATPKSSKNIAQNGARRQQNLARIVGGAKYQQRRSKIENQRRRGGENNGSA